MSGRIVSSLTEEQADMRKQQVGCMTGIFQLLDRHHLLIGRRVGGGHTNRKLLTKGGHHNMEPRSVAKTKKKEEKTTVHEGLKGKQMVSDQSSKIYPSSPSSSHTDFPETPKKQLGRQSLPDIQDVVKESMHREARSVSVKTVAKVEGKLHLLKHIDSPRPLKQSNSSRKPPEDDKHNNVLLQRGAARNPPRFSCDGIESRERVKGTMKLKDTPRLSLDSGLRSIKSSASESRSNFLLAPTTDQESGCHKRSSSVVAKLMGLEAFPESVSVNEADQVIHDSFFSDEYCISTSNSSSRLPLELAPWCHSKASQIKMMKSKVPSTVFGEIEKRITELEFKNSGKDLRALKQILEAMHKTRPRLECQKQEMDDFNTRLQTNRNATYHVSYDPSPRLPVHQRLQHNHPSSTKWETYLTKKFNSSILIPKQDSRHNGDKGRAKLAPKRNNIKEPSRCVPSVEKKTNGRTSKSVQDHNHMQVRSPPGAVSPRLQDKKQGKDKQPDSSRVRRHQNKQPKPGPPNRRHKLKPNNLQYDDDQTSETSSDTRNFSEKGNTASVQSERNNCLVSYMEPEVTSRHHTAAIDAKQQGDAKEMNPAAWLGDDDTTMTEFAMAPIEQPSPVSVLDAAFYIEDSPSPVKKTSTGFRGTNTALQFVTLTDASEAEWHTEDLDCLPVSTRNLGSDYNHDKIEDIHSILNTDHEDSINQIATLCQSDNFDHQYINKIVLASGILKDLDCVSTTKLHPSGNLINPELFHVLEQTEDATRPSNEGHPDKNLLQKMHRKIIFDTVNEILVHRLYLKRSLMPRRRRLSGQQLLKEIYAEIEYLQPKSNSSLAIEEDELVSILTADMKHEWGGDDSEIPALALSIERLIFKDLVTEAIRGDGEERSSRGHCRQLFTQ